MVNGRDLKWFYFTSCKISWQLYQFFCISYWYY